MEDVSLRNSKSELAYLYLIAILDIFDVISSFNGVQIIATGEPAGVFDPWVVLRFPIAQSSVTAETFDMVASF